jgi:hypothetical protein
MNSLAIFKVTQKRLCRFTLTDILLMAAINQVEAKRTHRPENASYVAKAERHARNEIATIEYFFS